MVLAFRLVSTLNSGGVAVDSIFKSEQGRLKVLEGILRHCYRREYRDFEALEGLEERTLAIHFMDPNNDATAELYGPGIVMSVEQQMMTLDLSCQVIKGSGDLSRPIDTDGMKPPTSTLVKSQVAVASCLGRLSMRDILHNYIAGLCHNQNVSMDAIKQDIQEIWTEETWRLLPWDESFLTGATQQSPFLNFNRDHVRCSLQCSDHVVDRVGFHQSLSNSFFLICDDNENFLLK